MSGYEAFVVAEESRQMLKALVPPKFPTWIGHHITHRFPATRSFNVPYGEQTTGNFEIVGYAVDKGIEAWVVAVRGNIIRPDRGTYHLTWSLDRDLGRKPFHSNVVIKEKGFTPVEPIRIYAAFDFVSQ
jgi:hypothetical protein